MLLNIGGQLFALVPAQSLEAGPEFYNAGFAPHNCVGGSEQGCAPGRSEAGYLFKDPSKMNKPVIMHNYTLHRCVDCAVNDHTHPFFLYD